MRSALQDRIDRVIHTNSLSSHLEEIGFELFEFQLLWPQFGTFEKLPRGFRDAITAGEQELEPRAPMSEEDRAFFNLPFLAVTQTLSRGTPFAKLLCDQMHFDSKAGEPVRSVLP